MGEGGFPEPARGDETRFALRRGREVVLHATGFRHPAPWPGRGERFTAYADLLHVFPGARALRIGSRRGCVVVPRAAFATPQDATRLALRLRERAAAAPGGQARLARMARLDARTLSGGRAPVMRGVVAACVVAFALQWWFYPRFEYAGAFSAELVRAGELWRLVTANFLHGSLPHLLLNGLGLLVLGGLLESIVGSRAAAVVLAAAALGAMGGSLLADYFQAVGASGLLTGAVGALLWLELRRPQVIPAPWRIPREILIGALLADAFLLSFVPGVAHAAHAGGFVAGAAATAWLFPSGAEAPRAGPALALAQVAAAGVGVLSVAALVVAMGAPLERTARLRAERLLELEGVRPEALNNEAWMIATARDPAPALVEVALRLAERAAAGTARRDPNILDTLAEVLFVSGRPDEAVAVIDEAIALAPEVPYFREQRRRFTGERDADDRPEPPDQPWAPEPAPPDRPPAPSEDDPPGIRV